MDQIIISFAKSFRLFSLFLVLGMMSSVIFGNEAELDKLKDRIDELEELLEKIEKQNASDRIHLTSDFRLMHHNYQYFGENPQTSERESDHVVVNQLRFRLNMRTSIVNKLRFTGRITVFKNWGENEFVDPPDLTGTGVPNDTSLRLERAYLDYFINDTFSFSAGRLPGSGGPPMELMENTPRKSTYPVGAYSIELDGLVLSWNLPDYWKMRPALRFIYGEVGATGGDIFRDEDIHTMRVAIYQAEAELLFRNVEGLLIYDHLQIDDVGLSLENIRRTQIIANATGLETQVVQIPESMAVVQRDVIHLQLHLTPFSLDTYFSYISNIIKSNGKFLQINIKGTDIPILCVGLNREDCLPAGSSTRHSHAYNIGTRYQLPIDVKLPPKIGLEYHQASKWYFATVYHGDLNQTANINFAFHNVAGTAIHLYWIQPLEKNLFLRFGYQRVDTDYEKIIFSTIEHKQHLIDTYVLLNARF